MCVGVSASVGLLVLVCVSVCGVGQAFGCGMEVRDEIVESLHNALPGEPLNDYHLKIATVPKVRYPPTHKHKQTNTITHTHTRLLRLPVWFDCVLLCCS